jgi:hypothetical protein
VKPTGRVLFSNLLRRVRLDGQILHVEDDHGTALRVGLGIGIGICALYGALQVALLLDAREPPRFGPSSVPEAILRATLAFVAAACAMVALLRLPHRPMATTLARADLQTATLSVRGGPTVPVSIVVPEIVESSTPLEGAALDGRNASNWLLRLRLPDRMLPLGTRLESRGRVPPSLLAFAHELHRLGFAPPVIARLDAVAGHGAADGK